MDTPQKKNTTRTVAAATAALVGSGLVVAAAPAEAAAPAQPAGIVGVAQAPVAHLTRASVKSPLVVHRSGRVAASASIAAAPQVLHTKKKVKRKYRSRRS